MKITKILHFLRENILKISNLKDLLMLIGLVMAGRGIYMIFEPAMWIFIGGFLIFLGWPRKAVK